MRNRRSWLLPAAVLTAAVGVSVASVSTVQATPRPADTGTAAEHYNWGTPGWSDEFTGTSLAGDWARYDSAGNGGNGRRDPAQISVADGTMTQTGTADAISAGMVLTDHFAQYGRWETRVRTPQTDQGGHAYHPVVALIPGGNQPYHCGATDIDYAEADIGGPEYLFAHNLPNLQDYTSQQLDMSQWHDFAVEVTPDHISWFVDGQVVMTDENSAIVSGVQLAVNVQLDANYPGGLNPATLQVDWTRYYPLTGDTSPLPAPAPEHGVYNGAC